MADKIWPKDRLGNEIKTGKLVLLKLPEAEAMFYVMDVKPATILQGGDGPIPVGGEIMLVWKVPLPFQPDQSQLMKAMVLEQPKQEDHPGLQ